MDFVADKYIYIIHNFIILKMDNLKNDSCSQFQNFGFCYN
jgi:hypothetical protein